MIKSDSIANLTKALIDAKRNITNPKKAKSNPFFKSKYADLGSAIDASEDALSEQGLTVTQIVELAGPDKAALTTLLMHSSGEFIGGSYPLNPVKDDPQGVGSAVTYARRYGLMAILGMAAEDDDGAAGSGTVRPALPPLARPATK